MWSLIVIYLICCDRRHYFDALVSWQTNKKMQKPCQVTCLQRTSIAMATARFSVTKSGGDLWYINERCPNSLRILPPVAGQSARGGYPSEGITSAVCPVVHRAGCRLSKNKQTPQGEKDSFSITLWGFKHEMRFIKQRPATNTIRSNL